jgi:predicted Fe-S protein YdhL (DUF1289 family)
MKEKSITTSSDEIIESPCIRQCTLDEKDVCVGCYRTLQDILNWQASTQEQKVDIVAKSKQRKQKNT